MNPAVIVFPLLLLTGGLVVFFLVQLPLPIRLFMLLSDVAAACLLGFVLWRRGRR